MFINPLTAAQGAIELLSGLTSSSKKEEKEDTTSLSSLNYNINDMSVADLKSLVLKFTEKGTLSESDSSALLDQVDAITQAQSISSNTKLDWINLFQQQVHSLNPATSPKEAASLSHSLDLLNGLEARAGANIPQFV